MTCLETILLTTPRAPRLRELARVVRGTRRRVAARRAWGGWSSARVPVFRFYTGVETKVTPAGRDVEPPRPAARRSPAAEVFVLAQLYESGQAARYYSAAIKLNPDDHQVTVLNGPPSSSSPTRPGRATAERSASVGSTMPARRTLVRASAQQRDRLAGTRP